MAIPRSEELMFPLLRIAADSEVSVSGALEVIAKKFSLTDADRAATTRQGNNNLIKHTQWAITYLKKRGLVDRTRPSYYAATAKGRDVLATASREGEASLQKHSLSNSPFSMGRSGALSDAPANYASAEYAAPEERMDAAFEEANAELRNELLMEIRSMNPAVLEKLILKLMLAMGYGGNGSSEHVGQAADGGIDGIVYEDKLGFDKVYLQAKRYAPDNQIGVEKIREFAGALSAKGASKGVFVTTSYFSAAAIDCARTGQIRIMLIDGDRLACLLIENSVAVRTDRKYELKKFDREYLQDLGHTLS